MAKKKPRPAKAAGLTVSIEPKGFGGKSNIIARIKLAGLGARGLAITPRQARRIGARLIEMAEYQEEKGE